MIDPLDACSDDFALFLVALNGLDGGGDGLDEVDDVGGRDEACHGACRLPQFPRSCDAVLFGVAFRVCLESLLVGLN